MGQIAEDIVSGFMCSWCGNMFGQEHGHPVACPGCWERNVPDPTTTRAQDGLPRVHDGVQKAIHVVLGSAEDTY